MFQSHSTKLGLCRHWKKIEIFASNVCVDLAWPVILSPQWLNESTSHFVFFQLIFCQYKRFYSFLISCTVRYCLFPPIAQYSEQWFIRPFSTVFEGTELWQNAAQWSFSSHRTRLIVDLAALTLSGLLTFMFLTLLRPCVRISQHFKRIATAPERKKSSVWFYHDTFHVTMWWDCLLRSAKQNELLPVQLTDRAQCVSFSSIFFFILYFRVTQLVTLICKAQKDDT